MSLAEWIQRAINERVEGRRTQFDEDINLNIIENLFWEIVK